MKILKKTLITALFAVSPFAVAFPDKPMNLYAGSGAGTGVDTAARLMAEEMGQRLKQKITVVNEPGASGGIASERFVARGKENGREGHDILIAWTGGATQFLYNKNFTYTDSDFKAVGVILTVPLCLSVGPNSKYKSFEELIAAATVTPIPWAGVGPTDLTATFMNKLAKATNTKWEMVGYTQAAQQITDLAGGHIPVAVASCASQAGAIDSGIAKPLVITDHQRHARMPDVPTIGEAGFKGLEFIGWYMLLAHKNTPDHQVKILNRAMMDALDSPRVKGRIYGMNSKIKRGSTEEAQKFLVEQVNIFRKEVKK